MNQETEKTKSSKVMVITLQAAPGRPERVFKLHKSRVVLGSVVSADIRLLGDGVSPIHAVIELAPSGDGALATVFDLASETGVFVNGAKAVSQSLNAGDTITIGRHKLAFEVTDAAKAAPKAQVRVAEGRRLFVPPAEELKPLLLEDERETREIFDYRGASKPALEVVMSWRGTILDVEHFTTEKAVTIGNARRSDFGIPPLLPTGQFQIIRRRGERFFLNVESTMRGAIHREGRLIQVQELRSMREVELGRNDFAKISIGDIDFYLSFTSAPPRLKRRELFERDPLFLKIMAGSMAMTFAIIATLMSIHVPQTLDAEQLPDRIATILYQPEKYVKNAAPQPPAVTKTAEKKEPKPKQTTKVEITPKDQNNRPIPKELETGGGKKHEIAASEGHHAKGAKGRSDRQAEEGKGARAKGKEGTRGTKRAAKGTAPQNVASRPSPQGGKGKGGGASQLNDHGDVDLLKGATSKIENLLGSASARLAKSGEKLQGFGAFNTLGKDGLALSGGGRGGGGAAETLGGLSDRGKGGGRVGTGGGAAGTGSGIVGGRARVVIRSGGPEEAVVMGAIDADAVERAILAHRDEFLLCYEREINAENPKLAGRVGVTFVIGSSGRVSEAGIASTTLNNANAERCILSVMKRIEFPSPRGGGIVQVNYPFKFNPVGK